MGFFDKVIKKGLGDALQTAVTDRVLDVIAPNAKDSIEKNTRVLNEAAQGLQQAAARVASAAPAFCANCGAPLNGMAFCSSCGTPAPKAPQAPQAAAQDSAGQNGAAMYADIRKEMDALLAADFPAYSIDKNVPATAFGMNIVPCKPFDYCMVLEGRPAALIMLTEHNRDRNAAYLNARRLSEQVGVPFINFYTHMPNERGYVVERIRSFL